MYITLITLESEYKTQALEFYFQAPSNNIQF